MDNKKVRIVSSFNDYYDCLSDDSGILYRRERKNANKIEELNTLKALGLKTLELQPANRILMEPSKKVIVYTDITKHNGEGKMLASLNTVKLTYPNKLCSMFYESSDGIIRTYKFLQVGKRRFWIYITNKGLEEKTVDSIQEIEMGYNYYLKLPIYSIDYILTDDGMSQIAVDFNNIQALNRLNFDKIMKAEEVIYEIYDSLVEYNKIVR